MVRILGARRKQCQILRIEILTDHSIAVSEGTIFAKDATGEDAKLRRQDTMWRVGLTDRKRSGVCTLGSVSVNRNCGERIWKYADYIIFNNEIMLCEGEDSNEAFKLCNDLIDLVSK